MVVWGPGWGSRGRAHPSSAHTLRPGGRAAWSAARAPEPSRRETLAKCFEAGLGYPRRSGEAPPDDDDDDEFARAPKTPKLAPKPDVDLDKARTALDEAERPGG